VREVEMRPAAAADVSDVRATADLPCARCAGVVRVRAVVRNTTRRSMRPVVVAQIARRRVVLGRPLLRPGQKTSVAARIFVLQPRVWSPADPQLERLTVTATARGRTGRHVVHVGIRGIRVVDGRLELNGQPLRVNGLGIHEDQHLRGHATTRAWRRQLMRWARETGGTMLRTHYPLHPDLIEQADRLGMLVWSEIPVYSMRSGELARANVIDRAAALARRNAAQNAHHPSILTWSVGNELAAAPGPVEVELFQRQADAIRSVDRTRPVSIALRFAKQAGCFDAYAPFDLIGQNQYFGWYYKRLSDLRPYMDRLRACYPQKAIMSTEFGVEANRDGPGHREGHLRLPVRVDRAAAADPSRHPVAERRDVLGAQRVQGPPQLGRRQPEARPADAPQGPLLLRGSPEARAAHRPRGLQPRAPRRRWGRSPWTPWRGQSPSRPAGAWRARAAARRWRPRRSGSAARRGAGARAVARRRRSGSAARPAARSDRPDRRVSDAPDLRRRSTSLAGLSRIRVDGGLRTVDQRLDAVAARDHLAHPQLRVAVTPRTPSPIPPSVASRQGRLQAAVEDAERHGRRRSTRPTSSAPSIIRAPLPRPSSPPRHLGDGRLVAVKR
jgi:hypothetical protein